MPRDGSLVRNTEVVCLPSQLKSNSSPPVYTNTVQLPLGYPVVVTFSWANQSATKTNKTQVLYLSIRIWDLFKAIVLGGIKLAVYSDHSPQMKATTFRFLPRQTPDDFCLVGRKHHDASELHISNHI